jgi:hypothetical protein
MALQLLGSSLTRTPSLTWGFSPRSPNAQPQGRCGTWGYVLGEEDSNPHQQGQSLLSCH